MCGEQGSSLERQWCGGVLADAKEDNAVPSKPQDNELWLLADGQEMAS